MDFQDRNDSSSSSEVTATDDAPATSAGRSSRSIVLQPDANNVVNLPEGVSIDTIVADGRDLIIQADGVVYVIPDGAIIVPQLVVGGVTVPALNLAALLVGNEPVPALGPELLSSGGNFETTPGDIQAAYGLGDLLPYTELAFPQPQDEEIIPQPVDREPTVIVVTQDNPAGAVNATAQVNEAGLPARNGEPAGTASESDSETTTGTINYSAPDGTSAVLINGVAITAIGQKFVSPDGILTITSIAEGAIGFSYTLSDNLLGRTEDGFFQITVIDTDGDRATATLAINVIDDAPLPVNDADLIDAANPGPATGNVITAVGTLGNTPDNVGADNAKVSQISSAADGTVAPDGSGLMVIKGDHGQLEIKPSGDYTYTRFDGAPLQDTDVFTYRLTDEDGSFNEATLTITIADHPAAIVSVPEVGDGTLVNESGLPVRGSKPPGSGELLDDGDGTNNTDQSESTSGTISFTAPDGVAEIAINGTIVATVDGNGNVTLVGNSIDLGVGTLLITAVDPVAGTISYEFTLGDNTLGDETSVNFVVTVVDTDGDSGEATVTIRIQDDQPLAVDDAATQNGENTAITVDVFANDIPGADGVQLDAIAAMPGTLSGGGMLVYNGDGTFTYTPAPGEEGTVTFDYMITDGDGSTSTAKVTITLQQDSTPAVVNVTALSDDDGLSGSNPASGSNDIDANAGDNPLSASEATFSGKINVTFGNDTGSVSFANLAGTTGTVGTEAVNYAWDAGSNTLTATGPRGVLFTVILDPDGTFVLTQIDNVLHEAGNGELSAAGVVLSYRASDSDGDIDDSGTLTITFNDDAPTAYADTTLVSEGGTVDGNVLTDGTADVFGADGPTATSPAGGVTGFAGGSDTSVAATGAPGTPIESTLGFLTIRADGSYTYVSKPNSTNTDTTDTFVYTIQDGDGDTSTQTLTITIGNVAGQVSDNGVQVDESGLAVIGSQIVPDGEFDTDGQITVTGGSGTLVYSLTDPATGTFGTLALDSATGAYSYTLGTPVTDTTGDDSRNTVTGAESFGYEVRDTSGNLIGTGTILVDIVDDVPTAVDEDPLSIAEDAVGTGAQLSGNVLTNDIQGADGASVTSVRIEGVDFAIAASGTTTLGSADGLVNGTYTFDALGNWTFDPNPNLDQSAGDVDASFTYTLTDGDGDTDTAMQPISVTDGQDPVAGPPITLTVSDKNLADGSAPATPVQDSGSIVFTPGSDAIASIVFSTDLNGLNPALTWVRVDADTITGSDGANLIVTLELTVTGTTATVTATLSDNFDSHTLAGDDSFSLGSVGVVATDTEGDPATGIVNITVVDDIPSVTGTDPAANALEVSDAALGTPDTADFSTLFSPQFYADGQNAVDPIVYALAVSGAGVDSGLNDVATGQDVLLRVNGSGVVEGYIDNGGAGIVVFTLAVDPAGTATLTQLRAVDHPSGSDAVGLIGANLITLTATITDGDGDKDSATVDLTGGLTFTDDGPSIEINVTDGNVIQLITQDAETDGDPTDFDTATANFSGAFTVSSSSFGADGAGSIVWDYSLVLKVAEGSNTGLASNGAAIYLYQAANGTVIGSTSITEGGITAGNTIFDLTIDGAGLVTSTQYAELDHSVQDTDNYASDQLPLPAGLVAISGTATITDRDSDSDSETQELDLGGNVIFADDGPHAVADTDTVTEDGPLTATGNVITNAEANGDNGADATGADGASVGGVAFGNTGAALLDGATVDAPIAGTYGSISIDAFGEYTYTLDNTNALVQGLDSTETLTETFTYTLRDGDGDTNFTTITITINGSNDGVTINGLDGAGAEETLFENDLLDGSSPNASALTQTGTFTVDSPDGLTLLTVGGVTVFDAANPVGYPVTISDPVYGILTVTNVAKTVTDTNGDVTTATISYTYVLDDNSLLHTGAKDGSFTDSFQVVATDTDGSSDTASLDITVVDDVPNAVADTNSVTEGGQTTGNLLTDGVDDTFGADGAATTVPTGGITGIRAANGNTTTPITDGTTVVVTSLGTLTLNANGSYTYTAKPNTISANAQDVFVYTIRDGDGDLSTTTLTINLTPVSGAVSDNDVLVNEAGLDGIGSDAASDSESFTTGAILASGGVGALTYTLNVSGNGTYGTLSLNSSTGTYSYVLDTPKSGPAVQGTDTVLDAETFGYTVTDSVGNIIGTGSIDVDIIDDVPSIGVVQNQQASNDAAQAPAVGTLHYESGADGVGSVMTITADVSGITVGQQAVTTVQSGNVLTAYVDADSSGTFNAGDTEVFTITVNPAAGPSGQYVFDLITPLDGDTTDVPIGRGSSFGVGPSASVVVTDTVSGQDLVFVTGWSPNGGFTAAEQTAWTGGASPDLTQTTNVNGSTQGWGLGNNNFDVGEFLRFDFGTLNDYDGAGSYTPPAGQMIADVSYATFTFFNFTAGETIKFVAHYVDGTIGTFIVDGANDAGFLTITAPGGTLIDWVDVYQSAGDMKLNLTNVGVASTTVDETIPVTVQLSDGDGDVTTVANFTVHVADGLVPFAPVAPIVLDLDGDGAEFLGLSAGVTFDYGAGNVATAWAGADDGFLARDTGSGLDIAFVDDAVGAKTDLEGLRLAFDSNGDGQLSASDAAFAQFGVWQDANSNGVVDAGEFRSLTDAGIVSINLTSDGIAYGAADGDVVVHGTGNYTKADGSTGKLADASFATDAVAMMNQRGTQVAGVNAVIAALVMPEMLVAMEPVGADPMSEGSTLGAESQVSGSGLSTMVMPEQMALASDHFLGSAQAGTGSVSSQSIGHVDYESLPLSGLHETVTFNHTDSDVSASGPVFAFGAGAGISAFVAPSVEGVQLMDALLALGQGAETEDQALAGIGDTKATQDLPTLQEAFADVVDSHAVDTIVDHFAGDIAQGPSVHANFDAGVLNVAISDAPAFFGYQSPVDMAAEDMSALAASA